ncbi:hypothetical protein Taro_008692 [Colocasia esculenta]|uniref:Uncharacterized protein n=1 Tax=Colocasia esculenta TaxID=4460 RepID=A0A843TYW4_COLES|nr:hypothetical protein [Colocasia esculenta]
MGLQECFVVALVWLWFPRWYLVVVEFWQKAILASTPGCLAGVSVQTWTPTLILASSDIDANFSGLHAQ